MKLLIASLLQLLVIFLLGLPQDAGVEATVGLYGPDRYEGVPEICLMPMEFGYCRAKVQRYYFDIRRMKCTMFFWGGCAGNDNNFKSLDECNEFCGSPYENHVSNEVVSVPKKERQESRGVVNNKYNIINSRDSKASPKFSVKPNVSSKETGYKSSFKATAKSYNVNPAPKLSNININSNNNNKNKNNPSETINEEEDYDE